MEKNDNYTDVTKEWLNNATPNNHEMIFDKLFIDNSNLVHPINGKETIHYACIDSDEYKVSLLLKEIFGGEIHLVPRITDISNTGLSTPTPDYIWNNEKWDLKTPKSFSDNIFEAFAKHTKTKLQANNFIIDIKNLNIGINEIKRQINDLYKNKYRYWINTIIIINNNKLIKVFKRK